jgi:S1-C subfamily serine protease
VYHTGRAEVGRQRCPVDETAKLAGETTAAAQPTNKTGFPVNMAYTEPFENRGERVVRWLLIALLIGLTALMTRAIWRRFGTGYLTSSADRRPIEARGNLADEERTAIEIFEQVSPSVVYVTTLAHYRYLILQRIVEVPEGTGSGFVWDDQGHIITNYHVVQSVLEQGRSCKVTFKDESTYDAQLIGVAKDKDLAVLRIDAPNEKLRPIPLGTSRDLKVGQTVFAIGNPFGYEQTLTKGIVSMLGREIQAVTGEIIHDVIQTDAAINPGNSGGPLLDSAGRLIGVNTAVKPGAENIGFAIPVDTVNEVVPQTIKSPGIRPGLGIRLVRAAYARRAGIDQGVVIDRVLAGSSAAKAGLRGLTPLPNGDIALGDIILAVEGREVNSPEELQRLLANHKVGDTVELSILRGNQRVAVSVQLQPIAER